VYSLKYWFYGKDNMQIKDIGRRKESTQTILSQAKKYKARHRRDNAPLERNSSSDGRKDKGG
jgi:hypothetical protein